MRAQLVGSKIRTRREALGLKQREVAARAGISSSYLNLIEHNHRRVAGKVLMHIAGVLDLPISTLQEGVDRDLEQGLQAAAAADPDAEAELDHTQDFISRFPGWARLVAALEQRIIGQEQRIGDLSDRLAHDPFLAESLHEILSSVTAIHATSGILVQTDTMPPLQRHRFRTNIHEESTRLSNLSQALFNHFDPEESADKNPATPRDEVEAFLGANGYHIPVLQTAARGEVEGSAEATGPRPDETLSPAAKNVASRLLNELTADAQDLPLAPLRAALANGESDPIVLARMFSVSPARMMRRLAFLPADIPAPNHGLIVCDAAGAVLLRKPISGFQMPRYGAACALWPLYQAITQPHRPLKARLATTDGRVFQSYAFSEYLDHAVAAPALRATMLLKDVTNETGASDLDQPDVIRVGQSCRICEISNCRARREPSIYSDTS